MAGIDGLVEVLGSQKNTVAEVHAIAGLHFPNIVLKLLPVKLTQLNTIVYLIRVVVYHLRLLHL